MKTTLETKSKPVNGPLCDCGRDNARWRGNRTGHREYICDDCWLEKHIDCIKKLNGVVCEIMPQMGRLVLQDYARLNEGLLLAEQLLDAKENS